MIARVSLLAIAVLAASACTKPGGSPAPRRGAGKSDDAGAWSIVEVESPADDDAGAGPDEAGHDRDPQVGGEAGTPGTAPTGAGAEAGAGEGQGGGAPPREPAIAARTPLVPPEHPQYGRLEGDGLDNACKRDGQCTMGGCAREVCSAQQGVTTTCEVLPVQLPTDAACGCVAGECVWYGRGGAPLPMPKREGPQPNSGEAPSKGPINCGATACKPGQQCLQYFGIAGTDGPRFESCEWPCSKGQRCPKGTTCTTIADGPGKVCR